MTSLQMIKVLAGAVGLVVYVLSEMAKARRAADASSLATPTAPQRPARGAAPNLSALSESMRALVTTRLKNVSERALTMAEDVRREARNRRFTEVLEAWIPSNAAQLTAWLSARTDLAAIGPARTAADALDAVFGEVATLVRQRRDPTLQDEIGAADALADACYEPIIAFATAHDIPLRSAFPATQLTDFSLSIWTGFAPTSIAPIFLPPGFFSQTAWWPALGHEIGHDFLVSVPDLDLRLRRQLGLPNEREGLQLIQSLNGDLPETEVQRLLGGWFEEIFCDVFGTLMCGPAFVASMIALFAPDPDDPTSVREADLDPVVRGAYDVHPPRHLRVLTCIAVLERIELHDEARALTRRWRSRVDETEAPDVLFLPSSAGFVEVPVEPFVARARVIVDTLCAGQLEALSNFSLTDIPGLDYGPHEHAATLRARDALLRGQSPNSHDPRSIIGGAVLAALVSPSREALILAAARAMIPSLGAVRRQKDLYSDPQTSSGATTGAPRAAELVEALLAGEILGPPRSRRPAHKGRTATSRV